MPLQVKLSSYLKSNIDIITNFVRVGYCFIKISDCSIKIFRSFTVSNGKVGACAPVLSPGLSKLLL